MRDEKIGIKKQQDQTNNKAKQHSTPKAVTFPKKKSCLGWDSNARHACTLHSRQSALPLSYQGSSACTHRIGIGDVVIYMMFR